MRGWCLGVDVEVFACEVSSLRGCCEVMVLMSGVGEVLMMS